MICPHDRPFGEAQRSVIPVVKAGVGVGVFVGVGVGLFVRVGVGVGLLVGV